ncbi:Ig-like domain-containing protein [Homoserinimonas sp. A520]
MVFAVIAGVPLTIAALHPGFPVTDVDLTARDVWVTNGEQLLGGRLNRQIDELNGSVVASSPNFDVLQDGDTLFMHDPASGRVESVNPASTEVTSAIEVPQGAEIAYGGTTLAILSTAGELWAIPAVGDLQFNHVSTEPLLELGSGSHVTVTQDGVIIAVSPDDKALYKVDSLAAVPEKKDFPAVGEFQLAAVGDQAVVLDQSTNELLNEGGSRFVLDEEGLRLQQTGPASDYAVIATGDSLLKVNLGSGFVEAVPAEISQPVADASGVSAPVFLEGCAHGAWGGAQKYLLSCDGQEPSVVDIEQPTQGSVLEFRVNRTVIALNNLDNGNVWLVDENMRLVENWEDVTPPEEQETEEEGDEKSAIQSFEDTLAERTDTNRAPTANDDDYGIRPGRTTILPVLENDSDPDGDVLVISAYDSIAESTGTLDPIDGGRALQFTPAPGFVGSISFAYTVDDGRQGTDQARVTARVVAEGSNESPVALREAGVSVEANQTISYNVLTDWKDPDGDDIFLIAASPKSGDLVRFTPDGFVTFSHRTSELGEKEVVFTVTDGRGTPVQGTLVVNVEPAGSLNPVGTPDFATTFVDEAVVVEPLLNDVSPSGAQLLLAAIEEPGGSAVVSANTDRGTITFSSSDPGIHYVVYTLTGGANTSSGIVRFDVREKPADAEIPPVAVKDTAYLRGDEPTTVSVLSNDVSPTGRILAIQSVDVPVEFTSKGLVVELLESTLVRVTSPAALVDQAHFTYTISDGVSTASAGVSVVPVPALTKHQPPVAQNDAAKVRVGDIITLDVLDNDFHPDDSSMFLDTELVTPPSDGLAFVSQDRLRFQAPNKPGEYRVDYRVLDPFGETAAATAVFTVTGLDEANNRDPEPVPLVARVLAGGTIRVNVPLNGIDPDGDSTQLLNFPTNPSLGSVVESGPDYFYYEASSAASGTDTFSYEVYDAFGATGVGEIKIAVIPEPDELQEPSALPDSVSIRPGRMAQVDLMLNDSDPQGAPIKVSEELVDVPEGIEAKVVGRQYLVIEAPETEQSFSLRYELTNDRGGAAMSYVLVQVTPDAPLLPPSATDVPILTKDIAGEKSITVDVFDGFAFNPAGPNEDLVVTVEGPNADSAQLLENPGEIDVTPGQKRQAIAYRVTNELDQLSAMAFILVPAAVDENFDDPPHIDPALPTQYVSMNETREWDLSDLVIAPSGREVWIPDAATVSGVQSNGDKILVDKDTLRFTPVQDYRGPAAINFTVTDGSSKNDPKGIKANLRLDIVVGDPEFRDTPPEFTTPNAQIEVGEETVIDLRKSTGHPNPQILQDVTYSNITGASNGLQPSLNGSELTMTVPRNTPKGTTVALGVTLRWDKFEVPGTINVTVVGSTRPLAVAVTDSLEMKRGGGDGGGSITAHPLTNDSNPYQTTGEALKIVDAQVQNTGEPANVSFTADKVRITPNAALKSGVIEVVYTVEDATEDADRLVNGTIVLVVSDVPDQVAKPTRTSDIGGDREATFRFTAPATNGKPISAYEVAANPSSGVTVPTDCQPGADCTIRGLTNGTAYTITVRAINQHGPGPWSISSDPVVPYGTPGTPAPTGSADSPWATANITWTWPDVGANGGNVTYHWTTSSGKSGTGRPVADNGLGAGNYTVTVWAVNTGGKESARATSAPVRIQNQTVPQAPTNVRGNAGSGTAPTTISWAWGQPANAGQGAAVTDNLQYRHRVNSGGWSGWGTGRTASTSVGNGGGTFTIDVQARNNAGESAIGSASVSVNPKPADPKVNLARGQAVTCQSSGTSGCYRYNITLENFGGGEHTVHLYCLSRIATHTFYGNSHYPSTHCGYNDTYVIVDGVESNHVNFNV